MLWLIVLQVVLGYLLFKLLFKKLAGFRFTNQESLAEWAISEIFALRHEILAGEAIPATRRRFSFSLFCSKSWRKWNGVFIFETLSILIKSLIIYGTARRSLVVLLISSRIQVLGVDLSMLFWFYFILYNDAVSAHVVVYDILVQASGYLAFFAWVMHVVILTALSAVFCQIVSKQAVGVSKPDLLQCSLVRWFRSTFKAVFSKDLGFPRSRSSCMASKWTTTSHFAHWSPKWLAWRWPWAADFP